MITSSDEAYQATKRIKQGRARLAPPFAELAAWIASTWQVAVLNVIYDPADIDRAPRLRVIVEHEADERIFRDGLNFDRRKRAAIASRFRATIDGDGAPTHDVDGLFVVFSAFAPLAREEADGRISEEQVEALRAHIANPDLWVISRFFGRVTFLFYTDEQVAKHAANGKQEEYARLYFGLLEPHDEFGYLAVDAFTVAFDSKRNFDENYKGNWYYYYK